MAKYGSKAQDMVESAMHRRKKGTLKSGKSGKKVTSKEQAIAIGLSEARKKGAKVPAPKTTAPKKKATKATSKKTTAKKSTVKKKTTSKSTQK